MAIAKANSMVEESLRDLVTSYHKEAQETKSWDTYNLAKGIYAKYLETFPDSLHAYKLRWYYSDILYKMGDFYNAGQQYALVVEKKRDGVYSTEASYNAVLCWEKCMVMRDTQKKDCRDWKAKTGKGKLGKEESKIIKHQKMSFVQSGTVSKDKLIKKDIPFFEKKFLAAADVYSSVSSKHDMYIPIRFKSAFVFYKYRHFAEMAKRFGEIIERYPRNEYALKAVRLSLNSLYMKATLSEEEKDRNASWKAVNYWAMTFQKNEILMNSPVAKKEKFGPEIQNLVEESGYNVVLALRKIDALGAASGFDKFVNDFPKSKYSHRALYAAMVIYDEANQLDLAIRAGKRLLKDYKKSDRINPTIGFLASFYDRIADFGTAAAFNEKLFNKWLEQEGKTAKKGKKGKRKKARKRSRRRRGKKKEETKVILITDKEASDSLFNAGLLRESMGQYTKAIKNYGLYIKHFPEKDDTPDLFLKIGKIYEQQGKWRSADRVFAGYLEKFAERSSPGRMLNVLYRHAMALRKMDKTKDSDKLLDKIIEGYNKLDEKARNPEARLAAAHSRFLQVQPEFDEFIALKLVLPPRTLKRNLFKKIDIRPKLEKKYQEIIGFGDPDWSVAALVRIAELSKDLGRAMLDAPVPSGLTMEQQDIYVEELQKQALPLEEKAIVFLNKAISVSNTKGIYGSWTLMAQDLLRTFETNKYPDVYSAGLVSTEFFYDAGPLLNKLDVPEPEEVPVAPAVKGTPGAAGQENGAEPTS